MGFRRDILYKSLNGASAMILPGSLMLTLPEGHQDRERIVRLGASPVVRGGRLVGFVVDRGSDISPFVQWWNERFVEKVMNGTVDLPGGLVEQAQSLLMGQGAPVEPSIDHQKTISSDQSPSAQSLSRYLSGISKVVKAHLSSAVWVVADVINMSGRQGSHRYLELGEYDSSGKEVAKARGMIWAREANKLLPRFEASTGMPLAKGMRVLVQLRTQHTALYGLTQSIVDIDPNYTLGELEAKIQRIRKQLASSGRMSQAQRLALPRAFSKVAVIAPEGAAGLGDFKTQSDILERVGLCEFKHYSAFFQGVNAEKSLCSAFSEVEKDQMNGAGYDAIVIIRGGGDTAGLMALNEFNIICAVCDASLPVISGIGHERDKTLVDEYGARCFATPSMVVAHITRSWVEHGEDVAKMRAAMSQCAMDILVRARERLQVERNHISEVMFHQVARTRDNIAFMREQLWRDNMQSIERLRATLKGARHEIMGVSPSRILSMGYAYALAVPGKTLPTTITLREEGSAVLRMQDGEVEIVVKNTEKGVDSE